MIRRGALGALVAGATLCLGLRPAHAVEITSPPDGFSIRLEDPMAKVCVATPRHRADPTACEGLDLDAFAQVEKSFDPGTVVAITVLTYESHSALVMVMREEEKGLRFDGMYGDIAAKSFADELGDAASGVKARKPIVEHPSFGGTEVLEVTVDTETRTGQAERHHRAYFVLTNQGWVSVAFQSDPDHARQLDELARSTMGTVQATPPRKPPIAQILGGLVASVVVIGGIVLVIVLLVRRKPPTPPVGPRGPWGPPGYGPPPGGPWYPPGQRPPPAGGPGDPPF